MLGPGDIADRPPVLTDLQRPSAMPGPEVERPTRVVSSPLRRCRETAQPLADALGVEVEVDPLVGEIPTPKALSHAERGPWLRTLAPEHPIATDLRRDRLDVAVRYGKPPFENARSLAERPDQAFPVCSPALLDRLGLTVASADLLQMPLITDDLANPTWMTWRSWARVLGLGPALERASDASRLRFNHYTDTVQAALNGEGVALGWAGLLSRHLEQGSLVRIGSDSVVPEERHHILVPTGRAPSAATRIFLDWLSEGFADPA